MQKMSGEQCLMRVFVSESDSYKGKPLYESLFELFHDQKLAGATVIRGVLGYGSTQLIHTAKLLRLSQELPMVIEVVDSRAKIDEVLPQVDSVIGENDCLITLEKVDVIRYGKQSSNLRFD